MRRLAILAVSLVFGQHLLELAHALTVEHVRCAEHGELVDVRGGFAGERSPVGVSASKTEPEEKHDHCAVEWLARSSDAAPAPAFESIATETRAVLHVPAPIARSFPLLSLAPKTSPPLSLAA